MTSISVCQAVPEHVDIIAPLFDRYRQFYGRTSDLAGARNFLIDRFKHSESVLFIACDEKQAVGFVQLYPSFSSISLARTFILNDLYVIEQARRKNVASKLLHTATAYARTIGVVRVSLTTAVTNEIAQSVYVSAGWKRDEQFYVYHFSID